MTETNRELARDLGRESLEDVLNLLDLRPAWQTRAVCHGATDEFFDMQYARKDERTAHRRKLYARFCGHCPVRSECQDYGRDERFGMWGEA